TPVRDIVAGARRGVAPLPARLGPLAAHRAVPIRRDGVLPGRGRHVPGGAGARARARAATLPAVGRGAEPVPGPLRRPAVPVPALAASLGAVPAPAVRLAPAAQGWYSNAPMSHSGTVSPSPSTGRGWPR